MEIKEVMREDNNGKEKKTFNNIMLQQNEIIEVNKKPLIK